MWPLWNNKVHTLEELRNYHDLFSFRPRNRGYLNRPNAADEMQHVLAAIAPCLELGFFDGRNQRPSAAWPTGPATSGRVYHLGATDAPNMADGGDEVTRVWVTWQVVAPLLRHHLSKSPRLSQSMLLAEQFQVAVVILHELVVCP